MSVSYKKTCKFATDKNLKKKGPTKPELLQGLFFALCFFAFQLTEFTVNDRAETFFGSDKVLFIYSLGIFCTALGFLSFPLASKLFRGERAEKVSVLVAGSLAVLSAITVLCSKNAALFLFGSALALFSLGNIGGLVYYNAAMTFRGSPRMGRVIGIGTGIAVLLQFLIQNISVFGVAFIVSISLSVAVLVFFVIRPPREQTPDNELQDFSENKTDLRTAFTLIAAVALMSVVCALLDGIVVPAHAAGQTSVSDYTRLFYASSLIAAGFVADFRDRKFTALVTVCLMFLSTVSGAFLLNGATLWLGTAFIYIYSGFYVMFLTVCFFDFAPKTKNPKLWAGLGRTVRSLTVAVATVPTSLLCGKFGSIAPVIGCCVLSVVIMLVLLRDVSAVFLSDSEQKTAEQTETCAATLSHGETMEAYSLRFGLTPRETEVLDKLLFTEDDLQKIADSLFISRRVLQRYVSSIYEKTATKTRIGLFQSFNAFHIESNR